MMGGASPILILSFAMVIVQSIGTKHPLAGSDGLVTEEIEEPLTQVLQADAPPEKDVSLMEFDEQTFKKRLDEEVLLEDSDLNDQDSKEAVGIQRVLDKAHSAQRQALKLIGGADDASVTAAKAQAKAIEIQAQHSAARTIARAQEHLEAKQATLQALQAAAEARATSMVSNATAQVNQLMFAVQSKELQGKGILQDKAELFSNQVAAEKADTAARLLKAKALEKEAAARLAKAMELERIAAKEKREAEMSRIQQAQVFEVNQAFLLQQKQATQKALEEAKALVKEESQ